MLDSYSAEGKRRPGLWAYHDIFDELVAFLSPTEFKVFYVIYRETEGFSRESCPLSETLLQKRTGIKSVKTLAKALLSLAQKGLIRMWDVVKMGGTRFFALGEKLVSWIPLVKNTRGEENIVIQRQLVQEEGVGEVIPLVKNTRGSSKKYQGEGQKIPDPLVKNTSEECSQPCPEEAPPNAKETLKEKNKETNKERDVEEEKIPEFDENDLQAPEWGTVLEKVAEKVSPGVFNSWFQGSKGYKRNDQFVIQVEDSFHKQYLKRQAEMIFSLLIPLLPASTEIFIATAQERHAAWAS